MASDTAFDPYAPPRAEVADAERPSAVLASPGRRLAAYLLDGLLAVPFGMLGFVLANAVIEGGLTIESLAEFESLPDESLGVFVMPLLVFAIIQFVLIAARGATLGKVLLGLRILRRDGRRAGFWRIVILRYAVLALIAGVLDAFTLIVGTILTLLVDPLMIFTKHHRTLHDRIADTIVVRTR